jgi:hypothetical protein
MPSSPLSISEPLARYAEQQAHSRGFVDAAAFVEHLLEADRRDAVRSQVEQSLAEGLASEAIEVTPEWWASKRALIAAATPESAS